MDLGEGVLGPEAKKSQKSLEKSKKVRKVSKNPFSDFFGTFGPFRTFGGPAPGDFFETLLASTPSPRSTDSEP